jgi:hypothetical protein
MTAPVAHKISRLPFLHASIIEASATSGLRALPGGAPKAVFKTSISSFARVPLFREALRALCH